MSRVVLFISFMLFLAIRASSQTAEYPNWIFGSSIGWQYQKVNFMKVSGWTLFAPNQSQYVKIDVGANLSWMNSKTTVIPEIGATYYLSDKLLYPYVKAELNPYTLTPKIGFSIMSLLDIGVGYGFDVKTKKGIQTLNGFTTSISVNIPFNFHLR